MSCVGFFSSNGRNVSGVELVQYLFVVVVVHGVARICGEDARMSSAPVILVV